MNERLKQLAEEAFFDESTNGPRQKMYMFGELKMQKFAELIVQECSLIADDWVNNYNDGKNYPSDRIKKYFSL